MDGLLVLLLAAVAIVPFVLPIVAWRRSRHIGPLRDRVDALEREVQSLQLQLREPPIVARAVDSRVVADAPSALPTLAAEAVTVSPSPSAEAVSPPAEAEAVAPPAEAEAVAPPAEAEAVAPPAEAAQPIRITPAINWEQWLGVRGAAALGAIVFALASILFFQYSIQHGLISPSLRVILGTAAGLACIMGSTRMLRRYANIAHALAGGGAVALYASFWAARTLYDLIPMGAAFVLMALVTATTALLASRYRSVLVAALGLAGGFMTPLLLASGHNRPIGLFGYLLLLDAGFLFVAYRQRWAGLALFALVGTLGIEALWLGHGAAGPAHLAIGLGATGLFVLLFLVAGTRARAGEQSRLWVGMQATAVLLPHVFALVFALDSDLGSHLYPAAGLLFLLELAALWLAARDDDPGMRFLPIGAGIGTIGVVASWLGRVDVSAPALWEAAAVAIALSTPAAIVGARRSGEVAGLIYAGGLFAVLAFAGIGVDALRVWPTVVGLAALTALLVAQAVVRPLLALTPALLGLALGVLQLAHGDELAFTRPALYLLVEVVLLGALFTYALTRRDTLRARALEGAMLFGALALLGAGVSERVIADPALFVFGAPLLVALLLVFGAAWRADGRWLVCAALPLVARHVLATQHAIHASTRAPIIALVLCALSVTLFVGAPLLAWPRLRRRTSFYVAALAGLAWLWPSLLLYRDRFGTLGQGGVALAYAAITLAIVPQLRRLLRADDRISALAWVAAGALALLSIAIPVELDRQWITIGYALEAAAVLLLWERLDHPGLKWFGVALVGAVATRLVLNPSVLAYEARGGMRIFNWVLYTYWVPTLCILVAIRALGRFELARLRPRELLFYQQQKDDKPPYALAQTFVALCGIAIVFVWINLAIYDWFGSGATLTLELERRPARDLTTSLAWVLYAIVLLTLGVWRRSSGLRWVSLCMMIVTIGKVFLYDLDQLHDLYRVVSLLGLAVSLIMVSLAYQRFVFRKEPAT